MVLRAKRGGPGLYIYNIYIGIDNHRKRMFSIMCPKKETEKQMKDNINKATKTFQRKISVECVNE